MLGVKVKEDAEEIFKYSIRSENRSLTDKERRFTAILRRIAGKTYVCDGKNDYGYAAIYPMPYYEGAQLKEMIMIPKECCEEIEIPENRVLKLR